MEEFLELNNNPRVENENRLSSRPSVPTAMNELKEVLCVACTNPPQVEPPVFRTNGQNILGSPSNFSVTPYTPSARSRPSTSSTCLFAVARKVKVSDTIENVKAGEDSGQGL
jgi:hypothetical protein